jgi:NADPH-dependent curcumin reductase
LAERRAGLNRGGGEETAGEVASAHGGLAMTPVNAQWRLAARPVGLPKQTDWHYVEEPAPEPAENEFRVQLEYLSLDPAMRGWMNAGRSYVPPVEIGEVMRALGIGRVVESRHPEHQVGDLVSGVFGVQRYALSDGTGVRQVGASLAPAPAHLSVLGMTGLTAYFGLLDVGRPEPGQTVVVSGAAGSVGSIAGQIARIKGCRVLGIAGGPEKCEWLTGALGFDAAIDYKHDNVRARLREYAPDGVDVYFDNVGGEILDEVLLQLGRGARVAICGAISQYNADQAPRGPANYMQLLVTRSSMTGFLVFDYARRYEEGIRDLASWLRSGELHSREDVVQGGIERFPEVFLRLFRGENVGKLLLELEP